MHACMNNESDIFIYKWSNFEWCCSTDIVKINTNCVGVLKCIQEDDGLGWDPEMEKVTY